MSSDEETHVMATGQTVYRIHAPAWRSVAVTNWLRFFDKVYCYMRFSNAVGANRGNPPRVRIPTAGYSTNPKFVACLPKNAYRPEWLAAQSPAELSINVQPLPDKPEYFKHDDNYVA